MSKSSRFGPLHLSVPESWRDESTIMFVAPDPALPVDKAVQPITRGISPNVVIRREPRGVSGDEALEEIIIGQERQIARVAGSAIEARGELDVGGGRPAKCLELTLPSPDGLAVRQLQLVFFAGDHVILFVATAPATSSFARLRPTFLEIARSIRAS